MDARRDPSDDWLGDYRPFDVFERFAETQRAGFDAATSLMERFTELFARATEGDATSVADPSTWFGARDDERPDGAADEMRTLRAEAARSMDTVLEMTRRLFESTLDLADAAMRRPDMTAWLTDAPTAQGLDVRVTPDGEATATVWLHHGAGEPPTKVRLSATPLRDPRGIEPAVAVSFEPPDGIDVAPGESRSVELHVSADADAAFGSYWAMVLADGLDGVALPLRVEVVAP